MRFLLWSRPDKKATSVRSGERGMRNFTIFRMDRNLRAQRGMRERMGNTRSKVTITSEVPRSKGTENLHLHLHP